MSAHRHPEFLRNAAFFAGKLAMKVSFRRALSPWGVFNTPSDFNPMQYTILAMGRYEREDIEMMRRMRRTSAIVEIGANIGVVSRLAAREKLEKYGTLVSIEPNPRALPALHANLAREKKRDPSKILHMLPVAIGGPDCDGTQAPFAMRQNLGSAVTAFTAAQSDDKLAIVPLRSLSSVLDQFNMKRASLICDCEGSEIAILDDRKGLARIDQMVFEVHGAEKTGHGHMTDKVLLDRVQDHGFKIRARAWNTYYLSR